MTLNTKTIISLLPFEQSLKDDLLKRYDTLPLEEKGELARLVWDTYNALFEIKLEENLQNAMQNPNNEIDEEMYERIKKQTEEQMQTEQTTISEQVDLSETREALSNLVNSPKKIVN